VVVRDEDGDAGVVKAILAIRSLDTALESAHIVAEINDWHNARTLRVVTNGRVVTVASDDVVSGVTAQACLQPGMAQVFVDLLDFGGDEIYFAAVPQLAGHTYGEAQLALRTSAVIGRLGNDGAVELNPSPSTVLAADDEVIVIAPDDSAIEFTGFGEVAPTTYVPSAAVAPSGLRVLVVGWSDFGAKVLQRLDEFLPQGSSIDVLIDHDLVDPASLDGIALANATLHVRAGAGGPEDFLALTDGAGYHQVVVLAYRDALERDLADARTLLALLTLRLAWPADREPHVRIVAELLDQRHAAIAAPVGVDDLIISDALSSLMMAQLAGRAELQAVFDDLFDPAGPVVRFCPAASLVPNEPLQFADVVAAASGQNTSAFGYRIGSQGNVVVNPPKDAMMTLGENDDVLLIATRG
jgi:archaellum component FlaG (FlaF/FlaG flagellin family)